jgi:hypothetical protein
MPPAESTNLSEERLPLKRFFLVPLLAFNPAFLFFGKVDRIFATTGATNVTIPILQDGKVADRDWHGIKATAGRISG